MPTFSIIIPTFNRPQQLAACLQALARLDYARDRFEVIVVDDGSPQPLDAIVTSFKKQLNLILLRQKNAGPAAARNHGAANAKAGYLAFTDDDCEPAPDWLKTLAAKFEQSPKAMIGGKTINKLTHNQFSITSQLIVDVVYRHYNADPKSACFFASNNMAMPAQRFHKLGGFASNFRTSEDRELCDRWRYHGWQMIYVPEATIYHAHDLTFVKFCRQHFSYGRGAYRYHQIRNQRGSGTMAGEMKFHANPRNWLLYPFTQARWTKSLPLAGTLLLWQIINAVGFFAEALKQKSEQVEPGFV
jgi:GT2 family glycosyltransferase